MLAESILKHVATAANLRDKAHLRGSCQKFCKAAGPNGGRKQPGFPHRSVVDGLHYVSTSATRPPKHPTTAWVNTKNCQFWSIFGSHTRPVECPWHILALLDQVIDNLLTLDLLAASLKDLCPAGDVEDCGQEPWNPTRRSVMSGIFDAKEDLVEWLGELLPIQGLLRFEAQTLSRLLHGKLYSGKRTLGSRKNHGIFSLRYDLVWLGIFGWQLWLLEGTYSFLSVETGNHPHPAILDGSLCIWLNIRIQCWVLSVCIDLMAHWGSSCKLFVFSVIILDV